MPYVYLKIAFLAVGRMLISCECCDGKARNAAYHLDSRLAAYAGSAGSQPKPGGFPKWREICGRHAASLLQDQGGVAAITMILMISALLAAVALVVDTSIWARNKAILQGAADSAALSAVVKASAGGTLAQVQTEALGVAAANGFTNGSNGVTVTVTNPPASGAYSGNNNAYEVTISQPQTLYFGRLIGLAPTVKARAVGVNSSQDVPCILALDPTTSKSFKTSGSNTAVSAQGCSIAVNSSHSQAAEISGGSDVVTDQAFHVVGNYITTGGSTVSANPIDTGAAITADPYASLALPATSPCDYTNRVEQSGTINPGVYCADINLKNDTLTMNPGVYVLVGANFTIDNSTLYAQGVSIVLAKSSGGKYGKITISGGSDVNMSPTTSGSLQGIVFYQDRSTALSSYNSISGGSNTSIVGSIYLPSQILKYSGGSSTGSGCLQLIALRIEITGSSSVGITCGSVVVPGLQSGNKKGLVAE